MTIPDMDCPYYDNDEIMAKLGREMIDMYIGQVQSDIPNPTIGCNLIANIDQYIDDSDEGDA